MSITIQPEAGDIFATAIGHHRAGRLDLAADLYQRILAAVPEHADAMNLLGVIAQQRGQSGVAADLIRRAIQLKADHPPYYVNLATALRSLGQHEEAVRCCRTALEQQPDLVEAHLALGLSFQALHQWAEAEEQFGWVSANRPTDSRGPQTLAGCLRAQGRNAEATTQYRQALARQPDDAAAHLGLGTILLGENDFSAAERHLRRAAELLPGVAAAWTNLGTCLVKLGRDGEAVPAFQRALNLAPNDLSAGANLGQALLGCGQQRAAENCFNVVHRFDPQYAPGLVGLGDVKRAADQPDAAIPYYEQAAQLEPSGNAYKGLADALWDSGDVDRAVTVLRDGIARHPDDAENHVRLATFLAAGGDLKAAEGSCREAQKIQPGMPLALVELAQILRARFPDEDVSQLREALRRPLREVQRAAVHFALAQVADATGEYSEAAEQLKLANAHKKAFHAARNEAYDPAAAEQYIDRLIQVFTPELFSRFRSAGVPDERPVFVFGMPRSGTTLVEQILSSHKQVFGAGERRFAHRSLMRLTERGGKSGDPLACFNDAVTEDVRACAEWHQEQLRLLDGGDSARVVDKMPDNYHLLGWLALIFPKARFIHCRRDVRDVALSCWMTDFGQLRWANDLEHIGSRVRGYRRLMEHWRQVLPVEWLDVDYEQLVANLEPESKRMVKWLGLRWDKACLSFHRSERLVKTASVTQVRQPIYTRSVGRWRHYEDALQPFLKALGEEPSAGLSKTGRVK